MKKRPFLMALLTLGAIFLVFLGLIAAVAAFWGRDSALPIGKRIGVIEVQGVITSARPVTEHLVDFRENGSIRAVVLRVNSPGGGVAPSQEICAAVTRLAAVKPVIVSMGSVAASGGYYIAAPATRILANPGSMTGSIGVIMEFTNIEELLDKIGLDSEVVKSGEHKDIGSPLRPMSRDDRRILQGMVDDVHSQFVRQVADSRGMDIAEVEKLADGRIFSGQQARTAGLVDQLGTFQDALDLAAELGGIEGRPKVVYPPREKMDFLEHLVQETVTQFRRGLQGRKTDGLYYLWREQP